MIWGSGLRPRTTASEVKVNNNCTLDQDVKNSSQIELLYANTKGLVIKCSSNLEKKDRVCCTSGLRQDEGIGVKLSSIH